MNNKRTNHWFPFEQRENYRFEDEPVLSCCLGKLFQFYQGRNVWGEHNWLFGGRQPNRRDTYPGDEPWCLDLSAAKSKVERQRVQGSKWTIAELPVAVISGETQTLIIGEINSDEP